jgi:Rrf2 family cysteine metabolism transcriptional repressor
MNISTKGRYGLRALIDLALCSTGEPIALYSIANRQGLSVNYLEQIFSMLRKEGIVKSIKGAQGGYILAEEAANIKVGDILRAIEGEIILVNETIDEANADSSIKYLQLCIQKMYGIK